MLKIGMGTDSNEAENIELLNSAFFFFASKSCLSTLF